MRVRVSQCLTGGWTHDEGTQGWAKQVGLNKDRPNQRGPEVTRQPGWPWYSDDTTVRSWNTDGPTLMLHNEGGAKQIAKEPQGWTRQKAMDQHPAKPVGYGTGKDQASLDDTIRQDEQFH